MSPAPTERRSIALMLGSTVFFAANILLLRGIGLAVPAADGWVASLFRGAVGLALVGALFGGRGLQLRHLLTRPLLLLRGALGGFSIVTLYLTVEPLGAGRAVIINLTYPIFASLIAALWLREHLGARAWSWMLAGFGGLCLFVGPDLAHGGAVSGYDLLALVGAVTAGAVVVMIRQLRHSEHTSTIYAAQCAWGLALALPLGAAPTATLPPHAIALLALGGILVACGQLSLTHAFRTLPVSKGSAIQMLLPILTAGGGFLLFGETFTALELAGGALTLFATWRVLAARSRPTPDPLRAAAPLPDAATEPCRAPKRST